MKESEISMDLEVKEAEEVGNLKILDFMTMNLKMMRYKKVMIVDMKNEKIDGMKFNPIKDEWSVSSDKSVNYIGKFIKN